MKGTTARIFTIALFTMWVVTAAISAADAPDVDIWTAAAEGNIQAIRQHLETGTDVDALEPTSGGTLLMVAALVGQSETAGLLIEHGGDLNAANYDGSTALHTAAFFCRIETVELLLDKGADVDIRNNQGQTALEIVATEWTDVLSGAYTYYAGLLGVELDMERVEATRPKVAAMLRQHGGKETSELNQR